MEKSITLAFLNSLAEYADKKRLMPKPPNYKVLIVPYNDWDFCSIGRVIKDDPEKGQYFTIDRSELLMSPCDIRVYKDQRYSTIMKRDNNVKKNH